jgi:hypothetical protein
MPSTSRKQHRFMEAIAHDRAFAKKVGVAQSVGKDFTDADKTSGRYQGKGHDMAKHKMDGMDGMDGSKGMSPRKSMAAGMTHGGGNFGVESFAEGNAHGGTHPDAANHTGRKGAMEDGERGIGEPIHHTKHHHPSQAAPHHGPHHVDGYMNHHAREHAKA